MKVERPARALALAAALLLAGACSDKKEKTSGEPSPATTPTDETKAAPVDVSFLVEPCTASGIDAARCQCAGDRAQEMIGAGLLAKMAAAPADDDPAIETYYSPSEMQRVMTWVDKAADACGIEDTP